MRVLVLIILIILLAGCYEKETKIKPKGIVSGVVLDSEGKPIAGVKVTAGDKTTGTNGDGTFSISDIDVGGNPKYYMVFNKANYVTASAEANFTSTLTVQDSGEIDGLPLDNSSAYVKVTMIEIVTVKVKLKPPTNSTLTTTSIIKVIPSLEMGKAYQKYIPKSGYGGEVSNSLEVKIKDVPRLGYETNVTEAAIKKLKIKVYIDGNEYAGYFGEIDDEATLNLEGQEKIAAAGQNEINLPDMQLKRYYMITGNIYSDAAQINLTNPLKVSGAKVVLKKGTEVYKEVNADTNGHYVIPEIEEGSDYTLVLGNYDSNGDGRAEYVNTKSFDKVILTGTGSLVQRNLYFDGKYSYSVAGKVFVGQKELNETMEGIKVNMFSGDTLVETCITTSDGAFKFNNVSYKNIEISTEDKDINGNGIADFKGYNKDDTSTASAKSTVSNTSNTNISNIELIMPANINESELYLDIVSTNYTETDRDGTIKSIVNAVNPDGSIEIKFNNNLSEESMAKMIKEGNEPFTVTDKKSGLKIDITYDFGTKKDDLGNDVKDLSKIVIKPVKYFSEESLNLAVSKELATERGYKYKIENQINIKYKDIAIDVNVEGYSLEAVSSNFTEKQNNVFSVVQKLTADDNLTITFNRAISNQSMTDIENKGEDVVSISAGGNKIPSTVTLLSDKLTLSINPDISLKAGQEYVITVNSSLASDIGYKFGFTMAVKAFAVSGNIIQPVNTTLSAITPEIGLYYGINTNEYPASNFKMDSSLFGGLYKDLNVNSTDYLDSAVMAENGLAGTTNYTSTLFPIVFGIPKELINTDDTSLKNVSEFRIYGKMKSADSFWSLLKAIKKLDVSKAEILSEKSKIYAIDIKLISGYSSVDKLGYNNEMSLTVIPVDEKGKAAEFSDINRLVIKDGVSPKIELPQTGTVIVPGTNSVEISENINPGKSYTINISGINENIKYTTPTAVVSDFNKITYNMNFENNGLKVTTDFNTATASEVKAGSGNYEISVNKVTGLYEGMVLIADGNTSKKLTVKKISVSNKIWVAFSNSSFSIAADTPLKYAVDNNDIFDRNGTSANVNYIAGSNIIVKKQNVNVTIATQGAVTVDTSLLSSPLLGYKQGDVIAFTNTSGTAINVVLKQINDNKKTFTTDSDISGLNGDFKFASKNQIMVSNGLSFFINEKVILKKSGLAAKEAAVLAIDSVGQIMAVDADITDYDGGMVILKAVNDTAKTVIFATKEKLMTGDTVVFNKNIYSAANAELKITAIIPVTRVNDTYLYKYEFAGQDMTKVTYMFNSMVNGTLDSIKAEFKSNVNIKVSLFDTSDNEIQHDNDEIFYNIYSNFPAWSTK